jgi:hypothetical protein
MPIIIIEKLQKGGIIQIKCWMELSSLVNRLGSTLSTSVLSFKLIALIVIEKFNYTKKYPKLFELFPLFAISQ